MNKLLGDADAVSSDSRLSGKAFFSLHTYRGSESKTGEEHIGN
jgi:hypothetical protein